MGASWGSPRVDERLCGRVVCPLGLLLVPRTVSRLSLPSSLSAPMNGHPYHPYPHHQTKQYESQDLPPRNPASDAVQESHHLLAQYPFGSSTPANHGQSIVLSSRYMLMCDILQWRDI